MNAHDRLRIVFAEARQKWRAFAYVMHVHENHYTKRAGVAGLRARGFGCQRTINAIEQCYLNDFLRWPQWNCKQTPGH
ncbi:hypothetical protein CUN65_03235 [Enterobacter hormaechei subsp. xiangfangensis]|nr:hypothetical protein CUN65_03235 [Enterobacter hormaechei subsp. xiangfangensis]AXL98236.1 hypothetical protein DF208_03220 [Enterobacter hormaechei subsp. xiangfangensis]PTX84361.1 hypothetical protein C1N97_11305 [Enterobacter hormaechei]